MHMRRVSLVLAATLGLALLSGCSKSTPGTSPDAAAPSKSRLDALSTVPVSQLHWAGRKRLAADGSATNFMAVWNLPASRQLEAQTLDRFAPASWRLLKGDAATNGAPIQLLRPLLDDLVQEESYLEIRHATNAPGDLVIAIRLEDVRARLWSTNLSAVIESLTGVPAVVTSDGWSFKKSDVLGLVELKRVADWTLVSVARENLSLMGDFAARIQRDSVPFGNRTSNYWIEANLNLEHLAGGLARELKLPADLPRVSLAVTGDGENVRTRGELTFSSALNLKLDPWITPTNRIREPLISFIAVRGMQSWLSSLEHWQKLGIGDAPNQAYGWSYPGIPYQTHLAASWPDASNRLAAVLGRSVTNGSSWLKSNGMGSIMSWNKGNILSWVEIPFITPDLNIMRVGETDFVLGSFFPNRPGTKHEPVELYQQLSSASNTVLYSWEITQSHIEGWTDIGQLLRIGLRREQLPQKSRSMDFLLAAAPKLGNCVTSVLMTDTNRLSFVRKSTVGMTGLELHLLADWLESPEFPRGLHTLLVPAKPIVKSDRPRLPGSP